MVPLLTISTLRSVLGASGIVLVSAGIHLDSDLWSFSCNTQPARGPRESILWKSLTNTMSILLGYFPFALYLPLSPCRDWGMLWVQNIPGFMWGTWSMARGVLGICLPVLTHTTASSDIPAAGCPAWWEVHGTPCHQHVFNASLRSTAQRFRLRFKAGLVSKQCERS